MITSSPEVVRRHEPNRDRATLSTIHRESGESANLKLAPPRVDCPCREEPNSPADAPAEIATRPQEAGLHNVHILPRWPQPSATRRSAQPHSHTWARLVLA